MAGRMLMQRRRLIEVGVALSTGLGAASRAWAQMPQIITPNGAVSTGVAPAMASSAMSHRAFNGHFYFNAAVNGTQLRFLLDTGASVVTLRAEDAARAGIDIDRLNYSMKFSTANGETRCAPVNLAGVTVGAITMHDVRAVIGQPGRLDENLLGQSFTSRLPGIRIVGDTMVLQGG